VEHSFKLREALEGLVAKWRRMAILCQTEGLKDDRAMHRAIVFNENGAELEAALAAHPAGRDREGERDELLAALKLTLPVMIGALAFVDCNAQLRSAQAAIAKTEGWDSTLGDDRIKDFWDVRNPPQKLQTTGRESARGHRSLLRPNEILKKGLELLKQDEIAIEKREYTQTDMDAARTEAHAAGYRMCKAARAAQPAPPSFPEKRIAGEQEFNEALNKIAPFLEGVPDAHLRATQIVSALTGKGASYESRKLP
jgi:hypothetical protein